MGQVLQLERYLAAVGMYANAEGAGGVYVALEAVPADVCGDRDFDRQRTAEEGEEFGTVDCAADAEDFPGQADAGAAVAGVGVALYGDAAAEGFGCGDACGYDAVCGVTE